MQESYIRDFCILNISVIYGKLFDCKNTNLTIALKSNYNKLITKEL